MSTSALVVVGYIAWTLALIVLVEIVRTVAVLRKGHAPNGFKTDGSDISPFAHRLTRAHANCYESFPVIGGILLLSIATGSTAVTDGLAPWMLAARLAQSLVHLYSGTATVARIRFFFFVIQLFIAGWWIVQLLIRQAGM
jgi:uncharacterized MAPEG superfamily protein